MAGTPTSNMRGFADDLVILIGRLQATWTGWVGGCGTSGPSGGVRPSCRLKINDEKSRTVDLERGECFGFLGFEFRYPPRSKRGDAGHIIRPSSKKADGRWCGRSKRCFRRQPVANRLKRVINLINQMLRGWVNYFRGGGNSSECFSFIKGTGWRRRVRPPSGGMLQKPKGLRLGTME